MKRKLLWVVLTLFFGIWCPVFVLWLLLHYPEVVFFTLVLALLVGFAYMVGAGLHDWMFPKPAANVRPEPKKPQRRNAATP